MNENTINWSTLTPELARVMLARELKNAEGRVRAIEEKEARSFVDLVGELNEATRPLHEVWGKVVHLLSVMNTKDWRRVEEDFQSEVVRFFLRVGQSRKLYISAKKLLPSEENPIRKRILEKMIEGAELVGVGLTGKNQERFNKIHARLAKLAMDFSNAVIDATKSFKYEKGGECYTIDDGSYPETMKHCVDRKVREQLYRARVTRAPENEERIREILALRREEAELLGFSNYAELSLSSKCAPSVAAVLKLIDDLDQATSEIAKREETELKGMMKGGTIEPWDRPFVAERLREAKYAYSEEELKRYFELEETLKGLFRITKILFGVEVRELDGEDRPSVWHSDVRFFEVLENGDVIAHFYFDPYVRPGLKQGGAWMNELENKRKGVLPLAVIVTNFPKPDESGRCLLPFREVETLFHEFGHALQQMLTRVEEEDAAGINLVEWDAVEVASQFMENWCLDDRTGITVPESLKAKVRAAKNFRAASICRRQLAFAKTDLILHLETNPDCNRIKNEQFDHFGLARIDEDIFLSGFTHIFAGGYAAGYYGYKWAEVMSADCYGAFEEAGLGDAAIGVVGKRYRETILALGGSKSALEVFREFRGRDPKITAILRQQDLV